MLLFSGILLATMVNKLFCLSIILLILFTLNNKTYAQETGSWQKLDLSQWVYELGITPWGIYAGEDGPNYDLNLYNGIYFSSDLGTTWVESGLNERGVRDLAFDKNGNLYALVHFWTVNDDTPGLFRSTDRGRNWQFITPDFIAASMGVCGENILAGSYHNGLWLSKNSGQEWEQKMEGEYSQRTFTDVLVNGEISLASDENSTFISEDCGETWQSLSSSTENRISDLTTDGKMWLACDNTKLGMLRSVDPTLLFYPIVGWGNQPCYSVTYYDSVFYGASKNSKTGNYNILKSVDKGLTWKEVNFNYNLTEPISKFSWLAADSGYLYATSYRNGTYRYKLAPSSSKINPFLSKLWDRGDMNEQTDTITSYFDHSYPLLAYPYKTEDEEEADTTTNYLGEREKMPKLYYSSHEGIDFGLKYGTTLLAPASGYASYSYSDGGGNTIKIDHQNGYQTQYLHLQKEGLYTNKSEGKWLEKGTKLGLVGLTGNTTGPHLHFAVRYDKNLNGNFNDDVPDGRVDPYAWQDAKNEDPWSIYSWSDRLGQHLGTESLYLWEDLTAASSEYLASGSGTLNDGILSISIPPGASNVQLTIRIRKAGQIHTKLTQAALKYVLGTAIKFNAFDNLGNVVTSFSDMIEVSYDLSHSDIAGILPNSLRILYFNEDEQTWEEIDSIWDETTKKLSGLVGHLSEFAVFGNKTDPNPPTTEFEIVGTMDDLWYVGSPIMKLHSHDGNNESGLDKIFYSIDGGNTWEEYITETQIVKDGVYAVLYRASDLAENYEDVKDGPLLRVDSMGKFKDEVKTTNAAFSLGENF